MVNNEERVLKFKEHFGKLVDNCPAFYDMIDILSKFEDKRLLHIIISKFWFIEHQRCQYWKVLPKNVKSYYRPYFRQNMMNVMMTALNRCGQIDITANMTNENGKRVWADENEYAFQFNRSNCYTFVMNVLSTYFKKNCKV